MTPQPDLINASIVAKTLQITLPRLRKMSRKGEYPELLHVTRGRYLVRRSDHEAWMSARWTSAECARAELVAERAKEAAMRGER
jgi:hypothetical protein